MSINNPYWTINTLPTTNEYAFSTNDFITIPNKYRYTYQLNPDDALIKIFMSQHNIKKYVINRNTDWFNGIVSIHVKILEDISEDILPGIAERAKKELNIVQIWSV